MYNLQRLRFFVKLGFHSISFPLPAATRRRNLVHRRPAIRDDRPSKPVGGPSRDPGNCAGEPEKRTKVEIELYQRISLNDSEKNQKNEMAIFPEKEDNDNGLNLLELAEEQMREKENLFKKIIELEAKLYQKQELELQIEYLKGATEVMKHMAKEGNVEDKKKLDSLEEELRGKEEELEGLEPLHMLL